MYSFVWWNHTSGSWLTNVRSPKRHSLQIIIVNLHAHIMSNKLVLSFYNYVFIPGLLDIALQVQDQDNLLPHYTRLYIQSIQFQCNNEGGRNRSLLVPHLFSLVWFGCTMDERTFTLAIAQDNTKPSYFPVYTNKTSSIIVLRAWGRYLFAISYQGSTKTKSNRRK